MPGRLRSLLLACSLGLLPLILLGGLARTARAAGPWYVAPGGSDAADCLSPATPCASINAAIGKASAGDTVYVATGTYTAALTAEVVLIDKDITLSGGWDTAFATQTGLSTLDGEQQRRGIWIAANRMVVIDQFSVERGYWLSAGFLGGGGVFVDLGTGGSLTLNDSRVISNTSTGAGGGIWFYGTLELNHSVIHNNVSFTHGGGVAGPATVTVNSSAVTANWTSGDGGGLWNGGGDLWLNNSTVSGNWAQNNGGAVWASGPATLNSSTVADNEAAGSGGGVFQTNFALVTLRNSLLAQNTASQGADCAGDLTSAGYNLVGSTSECAWTSATGDLLNVPPQIGPLVGSPAYHPLATTSPAVNAGNPGGCQGSQGLLTTDQRGLARVGRCDIGAYEYTPPGPAATLLAVSGAPQTVAPLEAFGMPLQAIVLDAVGSPVSGAVVNWAGPATGAGVTFDSTGGYTATSVANEIGIASSGSLVANAGHGTYEVMASADSVAEPARFLLNNLIWYVSTTGNDSFDCLTPATSCASLNGALSKAHPGGTIRVAIGAYNSLGQVMVTQSVTLDGGWDAAFTTPAGLSTLTGGEVYINTGFVPLRPMQRTTMKRFNLQMPSNRALWGSGGEFILYDSTVRQEYGAALYFGGSTTRVSVINSTIYITSGSGVNLHDSATGHLNNVTIGSDTATSLHVEPGSSLSLQNTLARSCSGGGTFVSLGHNLLQDASGCAWTPTTGDLQGVNPRLWPSLVGPYAVQPLKLGSPAINAGNPAGCTDHQGLPLNADQRQVARVGVCDIGAYEFDFLHNSLSFVALPMLLDPCGPSLCGQVRLNGTPAAGVSLDLRFYDGAAWSTAASTTTGSQGQYSFTGVPSLQPGQRYYVRYLNQADTPGRLALWQTRLLTDYAAGTRVDLGSFDIADVVLTAPPPDALVTLPHTFTWVRRPATPTDSYELDVYDPVDGDPYGYTSLLGYVNGVTITGLPNDFEPGATYVWEIWIYSPDGGVGISREARPVRFTNHGAAASAAALDGRLSLSDRPPRPADPEVSP